MSRPKEGRRRSERRAAEPIVKVKIVTLGAEPFGTTFIRLEAFTKTLQNALRGFEPPGEGIGSDEAFRRLHEALEALHAPSPKANAKRALDKLERGLSAEDIYPTFDRQCASLSGRVLGIDGIGSFILSASLGEGLMLSEVTLAIPPFPPPTIVATVYIARESDYRREETARRLLTDDVEKGTV